MDKLLTIIVPSYNMEKYLPKCLGSLNVDDLALLRQLDVIVVNDGSKDRTSEIAHGFEAKYPGVFRVIDKPNGNYGSCINAALPVALGKYVKVLDADDWFDTEAFVKWLVEMSLWTDDTDMIMLDYVTVDQSGSVLDCIHYALPQNTTFTIEQLLYPRHSMSMHAVAYRTNMIREIGYRQLEGISYTDTEWFYLPAAAAKSVRYVPCAVYRYLCGREGQTVDRAVLDKSVWMMDKIFDRMCEQYDASTYAGVSREYLANQLQRMFGMITSLHLETLFISQAREYFVELHALTLKYRFLSKTVCSYTLFGRTPFRFQYVRIAARYPYLSGLVMAAVRCYNCIRSKI